MNFNREILMIIINKISEILQGTTFALVGIFLPIAVGWKNNNTNFLNTIDKSEILSVALYVHMPVDKFIYFISNFTIAITAIGVIIVWKGVILVEGKKNTIYIQK